MILPVTMKVKAIHRHPIEHSRLAPKELHKQFRNPDPRLHPFEKAREYSRALVSVKLDKIFAKPFVKSLEGHTDSVQCLSRSHSQLSDLFTGSCDGEVRMWDLSSQMCCKSIRAHSGFVRGLCVSSDDRWLFSCGDDKCIKQWTVEKNSAILEMDMEEVHNEGQLLRNGDIAALSNDVSPFRSFQAQSVLNGLDHHYYKPLMVSAGEALDIWDHYRSNPIQSFECESDRLLACRFNPSECNLIAATAGDNAIHLYDLRGNTPLRKVVLVMKSNAICWNPMQPINFTVANEDHNLYTFDMRRLDIALWTHVDFTNAVLDVDYNPTGTEFVASSFDRTLRIFEIHSGRSREVYHTKRMQHVGCCRYTADTRFIVSGSSDFCVRIWKSNASAPLGPQNFRERQALAYRSALKEKYKDMKEIKRIARHRHVPSLIKNTLTRKREMREATKRKEENRRLHTKKENQEPYLPLRKKSIVQEVE